MTPSAVQEDPSLDSSLQKPLLSSSFGFQGKQTERVARTELALLQRSKVEEWVVNLPVTKKGCVSEGTGILPCPTIAVTMCYLPSHGGKEADDCFSWVLFEHNFIAKSRLAV